MCCMSETASGVVTKSTGTLTSTITRPNAAAARICKVLGCKVDLDALGRPYCLKKRLCMKHMRADAVICEGHGDQLLRFCQQCGKLEPLHLFEGIKRSCREGLKKRRQRESRAGSPAHQEQAEQPVMTVSDTTSDKLFNIMTADIARAEVAAQTAATAAAPWFDCSTEQQYQQYASTCQLAACSGKAALAIGNLVTAGSAEETALWVSPSAAASPTAGQQAAANNAVDDTDFLDTLLLEALADEDLKDTAPHVTFNTPSELEALLESELLAAAIATTTGEAAVSNMDTPVVRVADSARPLPPPPAAPVVRLSHSQSCPLPQQQQQQEQQQMKVAAAAMDACMLDKALSMGAAGSMPAAAAAIAKLDAIQHKLVNLEHKVLQLMQVRQQMTIAQGYSPQPPAAAAGCVGGSSCNTAVQGYAAAVPPAHVQGYYAAGAQRGYAQVSVPGGFSAGMAVCGNQQVAMMMAMMD